jgi:hypothetical protein
MKRKIISQTPAQPDIRGIVLYDFGKYKTGDTILINGYSYNETHGTGKYLVSSDNVLMDLPDI